MKRMIGLLLALLLVPVWALAEEVPEGAVYRGRIYRDTRMRMEPDQNSKYGALIERDQWLYVLEYGEDWSYCSFEGSEGYVMTDRIYEIWQLTDEPLPGWVAMTGIATVTKETHIQCDGYSGNDLIPGYVISAISEQGDVPMMRTTARLEEGSYTFTPFVSAEDAQPGDLLYAFTTWYNNRTRLDMGADMARRRRQNIELCADRLSSVTIAPGEQFSFNGICGPYSNENGYVKAPNISVEGVGVGGGVCQISTTVFEAMLGLDLQLDAYQVHQYTGVHYAPLNYDCAVSNRKDFAFTNTYDFPLTLRVVTQEGALTALFYRGE